MTVGVYKTRREAEQAAGSLQAQGIPAVVQVKREAKLAGVQRIWQVIVPREQAPFVPAPPPGSA
jgi:hypothetical protein